MYKELITALRQMQNWDAIDFNDETSYAIEIIGEAADAIEKLNVFNLIWQEAAKIALETEPYWISVTERMPQETQVCVVLCEYGEMGFAVYKNEQFVYPYYMGKATHWIPLPEPPKEKT